MASPSATLSSPVPLTSLARGQTAVIAESRLSREDSALLCAMGLCERAHIRLCRVGEPCVVAVGGVSAERCSCGGSCRIGLARNLAERIFVVLA